ncbi:MAG: hypothetical protein CM1200mP41_00710 [Gammaproteobacteria bacterium]|nr:MAG: hypothetical protein CM1200mP41_00710 [Gammaproteobacteria bacterium]
MELITNWFRRHFSNPQVVFLALFLGILFFIVVVMGKMVAPILIAIVIAYLLEGLVRALESRGVPRLLAVVAVFGRLFGFCGARVFLGWCHWFLPSRPS